MRSKRFAVLVCAIAALASLCLGAAAVSPRALLDAILGGTDSVAGRVFWYVRLPRTVACLLAGAALSTAGCVIQNVLCNPLASPNIIGVNAGAGLAVTICGAMGLLSGWALAGAAFAGAFLAVIAVSFAAKLAGASRTTVILAGVAVNATLGAVSDTVTSLFPDAGLLGSDFRVGGFGAVVSAVESGLCKFGVLPIENSANGSVRAVYELLQQHNLSVVRSTRLCIRHELLALPGVKMSDITEIYSHEQAIGQCSKFLNGLNGIRIIPCANTAMAAKMVAESGSRHAAAISSHACTALYGLECVNDNINDSDNNYTRFICVTKDPVIYAGANRISLILSFENKPGAL